MTEASHDGLERSEWRREAYTMAFYVTVCLVAALSTVESEDGPTLAIVWGTTLGLALAHLFAFELAARVVEGTTPSRHLRSLASAQLLGAGIVATITTIPVLIIDAPEDVGAARFVLSGFVGLMAFLLARNRAAGLIRSIVFALIVTAIATAVALIKNALLGH